MTGRFRVRSAKYRQQVLGARPHLPLVRRPGIPAGSGCVAGESSSRDLRFSQPLKPGGARFTGYAGWHRIRAWCLGILRILVSWDVFSPSRGQTGHGTRGVPRHPAF